MTNEAQAQSDTSNLRSRKRTVWKNLLFALLTTLLFFTAFEGGLAVIGVGARTDVPEAALGFTSYLPLFVENSATDGTVVLATAKNKLDWFNAQQFPKQKPPDTYRIFCVGGSTTYGRPYDDTTSFPGWLRELLKTTDSSRPCEIINVGGISYASYRVAALMEELADYEPDVFVVYSGHNEFLEERTYGEIKRRPAAQLWLTAALSRTRTWSLLDRILRAGKKNISKEQQLGSRFELPAEVDAVLDHTVGPTQYQRDDKLRQQILADYEFNLERMVAIARRAGADILFVTPASNLKDCSPLKSQHANGLDQQQLQRWNQLDEHGRLAVADERWAGAFQAFQQAATIDARFASVHFHVGQANFAEKKYEEAQAAFVRALDEDVCPLRAVPKIAATVARIADRFDVPLVNFPALIEADCRRKYGHHIPGSEYFLDHVHPTIDTNRMLGVAIVNRLAELKWLDRATAVTDEEIAQVTSTIEGRIDKKAHAVALRNLSKVLNWAGKHLEAGPLALQALEVLPDDAESLVLAAAYLKSIGETDQAIEYYRRTLSIHPDYAEAHQMLGAALVEQSDFDGAARHFTEVLRLRPNDAHAHHMLGVMLAEAGRFDEALPHYRNADRLQPNDAQLNFNFALALSKLGKRDEAIRHYRLALQLNPNDYEAHNNLGQLLAERGNLKDAVKHYQQALQLNPDYEDAKRNLRITKFMQAAQQKQHRVKDD